jgi:hypothetical protein
MRRNRWLIWTIGSLFTAVAALACVAAVLLHRAEPYLRARIVAELEEHFHARVELDGFHLSLLHGLWAEGHGLRIWPLAQAQTAEPLIKLDEFRFHTPLRLSPGKPLRISVVQLKGLQIHLPPKVRFGQLTTGPEGVSSAPKPATGPALFHIELDTIECSDAHLTLETDKPGKLPLEFAIAHLTLTGINKGGPLGFVAELTNPRPVGTIHTTGSFGPWQTDDPGESAIAGSYTFDHADLATFKGIAGILSSTGQYQGTLRGLSVDGETETPDFRLTHFGNPLPLHTHFHALVDATNGDTRLDAVDATLGHSHFTARGQIVRTVIPVAAGSGVPGRTVTGHDIALDINVDRGRIEDFLRLASHSTTTLLTGAVAVPARLHIPPGPAPVHERLTLDGSFMLDEARFTSRKIQDGIEQLSLRGQGRPDEVKQTDPASVRSAMKGDFHLAAGVVALPGFEYTVPGATIQLAGTYGLEGGALNFSGTAKTQATVSQMVGGWKGMLLKPTDRLFKKNGAGVELPIRIDGTREDPKCTLDFDHIKFTASVH